MRSRIVVLPRVSHLDELTDVLARVAFHFHYIEPESVTFLVTEAVIEDAARLQDSFEVPDGMDPQILQHYLAIKDTVRIVSAGSEDPEATLLEADHVLVWNLDVLEDPTWRDLLEQDEVSARTVQVDKHRTQHEGLRYIELASRIYENRRADRRMSRERFHAFASALGHTEKAYLLGTGPSIERYAEFDFSDGLVIACNTTILDEELMEHARPGVVTFADPIFHFGVSDYAASYRSALETVAEVYRPQIIIPLRDYPLFASLVPALKDQTLGVPIDPLISPNTDLLSTFLIRPTNNILTLLMMPLAASLAQEMFLLGFDGRSPDETYFWQHSRRTQFHDKLDLVKDTHPAFFDLSYVDYYDRHIADVERYALMAERNGSRVFSLVDSHVPALKRRHLADDRGSFPPPDATLEAEYLVISLSPDWIDEMGHHAHFERLMREAVESDGGQMVSLTSRALLPDHPDLEIPVFTHGSYGFETTRSKVFMRTFRDELQEALDQLAKLNTTTRTMVMMYTAALAHLPAIIEVASRSLGRSVSFHINLLRAGSDVLALRDDAAGPDSLPALLLSEAIELGSALNVHLYADNDELRSAILSLTGRSVGFWPMVGVTPFGNAETLGRTPSVASGTMTIYCPGTHTNKGYDVFAELTELMESEAQALGLSFVAREVGLFPAISSRMREVGVNLIEGLLTDDDYAAAIRSADVIALPYREDPFLMQTSGALADAIRLGKPVIATRSTWAGRLAETHMLGPTFEDGDIEDFGRAVREMVAGYPAYVANVQAFAPTWLKANNPNALLDTIAAESEKTGATVVELERRVSGLSGVLHIANSVALEESRVHARVVEDLDTLIVDRDEKVEAQSRLLDEFRRAVQHLEHRIELTRADRDQRLADLERRIELTRADRDRRLADLDARTAKREIALREALAAKDHQIQSLRRTLTNRVWNALRTRLRP